MRTFGRALLVALAALLGAGCHGGGTSNATVRPAAVDALPAPAAEPLIASYAPSGEVDTLAQIRIIFRDDLIPLAALESDAETAALANFSIAPAIPGHFRFLTPRMVGFQADRALPLATRFRVTLARGLHDVHGRALGADFSWTFHTAAIAIAGLPGQDDLTTVPDAGPLTPTIHLTSNLALDLASLAQHAAVVSADGKTRVALVVPPNTASPAPSPTPPPDAAFDPSQQNFAYVLVPAHALATATSYDVTIDPGVLSTGGNLPSDATFRGKIRTFGPLQFGGVRQDTDDGMTGRFANGAPELLFDNPIDPQTLAAIHITPAAAPGTLLGVVDGLTAVGVNPNLLAPDTTYSVTIGAALGDTFGQTLGHDEHATFRTSDRSPHLWAPAGTNLFPAGLDVALDVTAVNARPVERAFTTLTPADVIAHDDPADTDSPLIGPLTAWPAFAAPGPPNAERTVRVPLHDLIGPTGVLAYGVSAVTGTTTDNNGHTVPDVSSYAGLVQLTNLGVFAQWFPDSGFVRVDRISDGAPVAGAAVAVYRSQTADKAPAASPAPCALGTTGEDGIARFAGIGYAACAALDGGKNTAPALVTIVRAGRDWTYVRTDDDAGGYTTGLYVDWSSATPMSRGTIFSDRNLYQPGETAQLTAVGWFYTHGVLARGRSPNYAVELDLPNDEKRTLPRTALDAYGTASIPIRIAKDMPLGYYTVRASGDNGEQIAGSFRVAEFKPPNFKVTLDVPVTAAVAGASVAASATSTYLFGAPVQGAATVYDVTRSATNYVWDKDNAFAFGRQWFWPEQQPSVETDVLHASVPVDAGGVAATTVPVAADLPFPMSYEVDVETTDVSNLAVDASATFTAFPGPVQVGVKSDFVATAGTPTTIQLIALDPHGAVVPGKALHVELQRATYRSATQVVEGSENADESVTYATVASADATSAADATSVQLTPPEAGTYRIRANLAGAASDATATDVQLFVAGSGAAGWGSDDPNRLTVQLDKTTYRPGETARALIASPFPDADILVAVVRSNVLWEGRVRAHGSATTVAFAVTPAMLPNAAFEAIAVRRGAVPASASGETGNALTRRGFAAFEVALDAQRLRVSATPAQRALAPAAHQRVHFHVVDRAGRPAAATQLTVVVANEAVLQLSDYHLPDLLQVVYADEPISIRFADNRGAIVLRTPTEAVDKGWGFGGGLSTGAEDTRIRRTFEPLAYYAAALRTDANGDATATFDLPDDLTTWRVMAEAATTDGRFGTGETTFHTTKPLIVNPVVPQFARPGDRFEAGVAITNGTGATSGTVAIEGALTGPLSFLDAHGNADAHVTFSAPIERITKAYRFPVAATAAGTSEATFRATASGAGGRASDGFAIPVAVLDHAVTESVVTTGVSAATTTIPLAVAPGTPTDAGGVTLVLANSLIPDAIVAADAAFADDDRLALGAASRLSVAADVLTLTALTNTAGPVAQARTAATSALATLAALQRPGGGFAAFPGAKSSDPYDSLGALRALAAAQGAGIAVDAALLDRAHAYAAALLDDPGTIGWCKREPCKSQLRLHALDALAAAGDRRTTFLGDIDAQRTSFCLADRIRLARYLLLAPGYAQRGAAEADALAQRVYQTGTGAAFNAPERYAWFARPVVAQALLTQLLVARHAAATTIDGLTHTLLGLRRNGSWGCACENAAALDALVAVARAAGPPPNLSATATLAGTLRARADFTGHRAATVSATIPAAQLPRGASSLVLAPSGGALHYAVTYTYRLDGAQPGVLAGLRITRIVHAAGADAALATMGLTRQSAALTLPAARVFDVELQIVADHPVDRVQITDPLPAGMEAVDTSFATSNAQAPAQSWQIDDQQIYHDRIEAYADHLGPGIYVLHYLARTVTPGTFAWPGALARLAADPQAFGRSASATLVVR